jgi:hypothetical protein
MHVLVSVKIATISRVSPLFTTSQVHLDGGLHILPRIYLFFKKNYFDLFLSDFSDKIQPDN